MSRIGLHSRFLRSLTEQKQTYFRDLQVDHAEWEKRKLGAMTDDWCPGELYPHPSCRWKRFFHQREMLVNSCGIDPQDVKVAQRE